MSYGGGGSQSKTRLFVGGLSESINKEDLEAEFGKYGKLSNVWVAQNPPGFAFVEYDDSQDAEEAVKQMNGAVISGCNLRVEHSRERRGRGRGRGRGFGGRDGRGRGFGGGRGGGFGGGRGGGYDRPRRGGYDNFRSGQSGWDSSRSYGGGRSYDNQRDGDDGYSSYRSRSPLGGSGGGGGRSGIPGMWNADAPCPSNTLKSSETRMGSIPDGSALCHQLSNLTITVDKHNIKYPSLPMEVLVVDEQPERLVPGTRITLEKAAKIEEVTRFQNTDLWFNERKFRLTASKFGLICKRQQEVTDGFLKSLYENFFGRSRGQAEQYGKRSEPKAASAYVKYMAEIGKDVQVYRCGLVINPGVPFLGCSPDGRVLDRSVSHSPEFGLLEIKSPTSKVGMSLSNMRKDPNFFCVVDLENETIRLKRATNYYYQVQGQIHLSGASWCDFVLYNGQDVWVERIHKDASFCRYMVGVLTRFYVEHFYDYVTAKRQRCRIAY